MLCIWVLVLFLTSVCGLIMPMTKEDGTLDVSSLLSHISLLEQTMEQKASVSDVTNLKSQLQAAQADLKTAQADLKTTETELKATQTQLQSTQTELDEVKSDLKENQVETIYLKSELSTVLSDLKTAQLELTQLQPTADALREVTSALKATKIKVAVLESQSQSAIAPCSCNSTTVVTQPSTDITNLQADIYTLKTDVFHLQSQKNATIQTGQTSQAGGATFTRWGKTACPNDTKEIYKDPIYDAQSTSGWYAFIYGTEYETGDKSNPFYSRHDDDMPCVVCENESKMSAIMLPARNLCYPGWELEYTGYLMGTKYDHASGEYICVDKEPEAIAHSQADENGQLLLVVQSVCGSLSCPPYKDKGDLTCAVCSK